MNHNPFVKYIKIIIMLALTAILIVACGNSDSDPAETTASTDNDTAQTTEVAEPETPEATEKIFNFIDPNDWSDVDPRASTDNDFRLMYMMYETLTRYNEPGSGEEAVSPWLATSWEKNEEATEWTFHLREDVTFHDGTPLTAEAVKGSFEKMLEMDLGAAYLWYPILEMNVVDDHTITFILEYPQPLDIMFSSLYQAWIISPEVIDNPTESFNEELIHSGTGPWLMDEFLRDERAIFSRYDGYWGGWTDEQYDRIIIEVVQDPATIFQRIQAGEVDGAVGILPEQISLVDNLPNYEAIVGPSFQSEHWQFNTGRPPLDDARVRQALSYAFPYDDCITAAEGLASPSRTGIPAGQVGYDPNAFQYTYDLDKARELLEEAGVADGFTLTMNNFTYWTQATQACPLLWQAELAKLNVKLEIVEVNYDTAWAIAQSDPTGQDSEINDVFRQLWWVTYPTAFDYLFSMYGCEQFAYNLSYYCEEDFNDLILEGNVLEGLDLEAAQTTYEDAQALLAEDAPAVWPRDLLSVYVISSDVDGFVPNPAYNLNFDFYQFTTD